MTYRVTLVTALLAGACGSQDLKELHDPEPAGEGVAYDEAHPGADLTPMADRERVYQVPEWVLETEFVDPEVVVSLDGLTVHLFDRGGNLSRVYPTGVGMLDSTGRSFTPTGFFATSPDPSPSWWNLPERFMPNYFGGFPFLRITTHNSRGENTYGLHGPITYSCPSGAGNCALEERQWHLVRDYVSHGCMRMRAQDIVELYYLLEGHPSVPVTIQALVEIDAYGNEIAIEDQATTWPFPSKSGEQRSYGELGPRPANWDPCAMPPGWPHRAYGC